MGDSGPERQLRFWSEDLNEAEAEPGSSGEQLPSRRSSLWRPLMVVGWMGSSTDDAHVRSFSCSPLPPPSSSSGSSSSSSIPGTRWSLARFPSDTEGPSTSASSNCRLWTRPWRGTLSWPESWPDGVDSVWVDLSTVAGTVWMSVDAELPLWLFALVTVVSDSWLESSKVENNTKQSYRQFTQTYEHNDSLNRQACCLIQHNGPSSFVLSV